MGCHYCERGEGMDKIGLEVATLPASTVFLFREQSHPGRLIVAYKEHGVELYELSDADRNAFFADVQRAAKALKTALNPDKINYGAYSDTLPHLHMHLVPKYKDQFEWGSVFAMNPEKKVSTDDECRALIEKIKAAL